MVRKVDGESKRLKSTEQLRIKNLPTLQLLKQSVYSQTHVHRY
jgi:hypothetical protein